MQETKQTHKKRKILGQLGLSALLASGVMRSVLKNVALRSGLKEELAEQAASILTLAMVALSIMQNSAEDEGPLFSKVVLRLLEKMLEDVAKMLELEAYAHIQPAAGISIEKARLGIEKQAPVLLKDSLKELVGLLAQKNGAAADLPETAQADPELSEAVEFKKMQTYLSSMVHALREDESEFDYVASIVAQNA